MGRESSDSNDGSDFPVIPEVCYGLSEPQEGTDNIAGQNTVDIDDKDSADEEKKDGVKKYLCDFENCKAEFSRPWRLASHKCTHTGERPYPCTESGCDKAYTNPSHLKRHVRTAHTAQPIVEYFQCTYPGCTDKLKTLPNLKRHIKRRHESNKEMYSCQQCEAKFTRNWKLKEHMFEHTGVLPFTCPICNKGFKTCKQLRKHERQHKLYRCKVTDCNQIFRFWTHYRKHMIIKHRPDYTCECCERTFYSNDRLKYHIKTVHCKDEEKPSKWMCYRDGCNRIFKHKRNLAQHVRHRHEGNYFVCPVEDCGKHLLWKSSYDKHMRLHDANRPLPRPRKKPSSKRKDTGIPKKSCASVLSNVALPVESDKALIQKDTMDSEELSIDEAIEEEMKLEESDKQRPEIEHVNIKTEYTVPSDVEESSNVEDNSDFEVYYRNVGDKDSFIEDSGATSDSSCNTRTVLTKY